MRFETLAVHAGRAIDESTRAVAAPIHLSTTFERGADLGYPKGFSYSREDNPNRRDLETCLAALEGGTEALAFSSGLAAVQAVLQAMEPGDHILAPDDVYYGLRKLVTDVFAKNQLQVDYIDMTNLEQVRSAVRPNTKLIWVETPSNPLLKVTDLEAISAIARQAGAMTVCDATFATPVLQRTLELGIDVVMHSTTKYLGGHSDVMGGALITRHPSYLFERARTAQRFGGAVPSPFDCWLLRRGIDTLALRVKAQGDGARQLAEFLEGHPAVERVYYPGLSSHPQYEVARRQMAGGGGMLSFLVRAGEQAAIATTLKMRVATRATSLGGTHTLIEHRASVEGPASKTPKNLLRVSVGIEHAEDVVSDFAQAIAV